MKNENVVNSPPSPLMNIKIKKNENIVEMRSLEQSML